MIKSNFKPNYVKGKKYLICVSQNSQEALNASAILDALSPEALATLKGLNP